MLGQFFPSMSLDLRHTDYITSANKPSQLPPDEGTEVAFAGRSNAGKSSAINAICQRRGLARTSKTPGRTQLINFFAVAPSQRLVDLPGYGYAKVPTQTRQHWGQLIHSYLSQRHSLRGLILIMDCRHPLNAMDQQLVDWCAEHDLAVHILLSKADKLSRGAGLNTLQQVKEQLRESQVPVETQLFSATKGTGVDSARERLLSWLLLNEGQ